MKLSALLGDEIAAPAGCGAIDVAGITADSRAVRPGFIFAALAGARADGSRYIGQAMASGAVAVLAANTSVLPDGLPVPVLRTNDPRLALSRMAARFCQRQPAHIVAVTGTSGKTSVAEFTRQILAHCGRKAASLGTIGVVKPDGAVYGSLTTPDPVSLHQTLAGLAEEGVTHLAMEASSHGLDQRRLDGVRLTAGAFTNLGRDHMDYHPTVEDYFSAKLRLFTELLPVSGTAVVDADDSHSAAVIAAARQRGLRIVATGRAGADLALERLAAEGFTQAATVRHAGQRYDLRVPLIGSYQVSNALVATGLAIAVGEKPESALAAIEHLKTVNGRLDVVGECNGGLVVVDYAHKPDALQAALAALRPFVSQGSKLICVFGCGGDRDKGKRPIMGEISARMADVTIVTDDNPRSEDPARIRAEVIAGAKTAADASLLEIGDRAAAIDRAIAMMEPGDVVLVAGKGHEPGQTVGDTVLPFSDHEAARAAIVREAGR